MQRLVKPLAFGPVAAKFSQRVSGCSEETQKTLQTNILGEDGDRSLINSFFKDMVPPLMPGRSLDAMNRIMTQSVAQSIDELMQDGAARINLSTWLRHHITIATTKATYGPANPFLDQHIEDAFWTFERNLLLILVNILPYLTTSTAIRARKIVSDAFLDYFRKNKHAQRSALVQARVDNAREYGVPIEDIAGFEVGGAIAVLVNTYPTAFWMIHYVFSNTQVLADCREELAGITKSITDAQGTTTHHIDMLSIKTNCPILTSTLQEVLRHRAVGTSVREVMEDTLLDGQYLLRKGCTLLIPTDVLHSDRALWGDDVAEFNHRRFLKSPGKKLPNPVAFRAFGGGTTLCPGRHFASTEVMAVASIFIARFDISPVGGQWPNAEVKNINLWAQIVEADPNLEINVVPREVFGQGRHKWEFGLSDSEMLFALAAEDRG